MHFDHAGVPGEASNRRDIYDPNRHLASKQIAFCRVEADNSTLQRGWEVVYIYEVDQSAGTYSGVYLRPAVAGPPSTTAGHNADHWPNRWWQGDMRPFSHVPFNQATLRDWAFTDGRVSDVIWSGNANGTSPPYSLRQGLHARVPGVLSTLSDAGVSIVV